MASDETISVYPISAPFALQIYLNALSEYPATGARNRFPETSNVPILTG